MDGQLAPERVGYAASAPGTREHAAYLRRMGFGRMDPQDEMAAYGPKIAA